MLAGNTKIGRNIVSAEMERRRTMLHKMPPDAHSCPVEDVSGVCGQIDNIL
jgi:hypothetical protein